MTWVQTKRLGATPSRYVCKCTTCNRLPLNSQPPSVMDNKRLNYTAPRNRCLQIPHSCEYANKHCRNVHGYEAVQFRWPWEVWNITELILDSSSSVSHPRPPKNPFLQKHSMLSSLMQQDAESLCGNGISSKRQQTQVGRCRFDKPRPYYSTNRDYDACFNACHVPQRDSQPPHDGA